MLRSPLRALPALISFIHLQYPLTREPVHVHISWYKFHNLFEELDYNLNPNLPSLIFLTFSPLSFMVDPVI